MHCNPNTRVEQLQQHPEALAAGQGPAARCRLRLHPPRLHPACSRQRWRATRCSRCGDCRTAAEGRDPAVAAQVVQQHHLMCPGVSIQLFQVLPRPTQESASRLRPCLLSGSAAPSDSGSPQALQLKRCVSCQVLGNAVSHWQPDNSRPFSISRLKELLLSSQ